MNILVIGSGGREHALAWKIAQSAHLEKLYISPGNPGTAEVGQNVHIAGGEWVSFCREHHIDLVVIGPEAPLAAGLGDELAAAGIPVFGPSRRAAQLETSKAFAKQFMARHHIPTARYAVFQEYEPARKYLESIPYPVVLKASGLAAGKGVLLPETAEEALDGLKSLLIDRKLGSASDQVVIEERLFGDEVSLLGFTDGKTVCPLPPAQDHKRLLEGDQGPNTGGMGAYAPAPVCPPQMVGQLVAQFLQPAVDGCLAEGFPYIGVLYAGLILTADGPRLLEFNCRFGDPETQVLLPLLETDFLEIALACTQGHLHEIQPVWKREAAACVVLASQGYPESASPATVIHGLDQAEQDVLLFHAGTRWGEKSAQGRTPVLAAGGRVLGVAATGSSLPLALEKAYRAINQIQFEGMRYRRDIGWRALKSPAGSAYAASGVNIDAGNQAVSLMRDAVKSTYGAEVLSGIGAFGGLFDARQLKEMNSPVLVASTDGVGTKVKLAAQANRFRSIGQDLVNHCINDILVQGARPLFFMDYFASDRLEPRVVAEVVTGIAEACKGAGCALLGGETAEMPGVYTPGDFDLAGTIVGIVEGDAILPRGNIQAGDLLLGLTSSGPHTNGYSLIRNIFAGADLETYEPGLGGSLADALLAPHRAYLPALWPLLQADSKPIKALAHITGGGFIENIPRILPANLDVQIRRGSWPVPPVFKLIQQRGEVSEMEMYRVFNMGIGMVMVVDPADADQVKAELAEPCYEIGRLAAGEGKVQIL